MLRDRIKEANMRTKQRPAKPKTAKRLTPSIKADTVNPSDWIKYDFRSACEDCSHFKFSDLTCTLGYNTKFHREQIQQEQFFLSGKIAQCRFLEID